MRTQRLTSRAGGLARREARPVEDNAGDLSPHTQDSYARALVVFSEWLAEHEPELAAVGYPGMLVGVSPPMVRTWRAWLAASYQPATVNARLAGLRRFYTVLVEEGVVPRNPVDGIKRARVAAFSPLAVISEEQAGAMLAACSEDPTLRGRRDEALLGLALSCGLRKKEILSLSVGSLKQAAGHDVVEFVRKGGEPTRSVLTPRTLRRLERWVRDARLTEGPLWRAVYGPPTRPDDGSWRASPRCLSASALDALVARRAAQAGVVDRFTPHCLRRSACDWLWARGVPPQQIKAFMGHRSITTTDRYRVERESLDTHASHLLGWV